ncbi:MAG TPA: methylenetetrahydrofolate--tRNA-(uracil(54)-C(5))-methyltransferase (FADH(2)-oxidizing) TrmFO, partial [Terriglobia bacterium]|nr:methylenetetrahydrofolate--tRNA-(uracil(54)-C(5))-methyltransferase (FADH(2)-oxidizing) TrmFO [Terriglobia bacterium]
GSGDILSAPGILKEELRRLNSLIIRVADEVRVPAGAAIAVDRDHFSQRITRTLEEHPNIRILHEEIKEIPTDCVCIIATGPLTSDSLAGSIRTLTHEKSLYFYDAISPIIDADSIDMDRVFRASRYDKGTADYLNCPMDQATYDLFYDALMKADKVQPKEFEKVPYFEGCIPIEVMAERGPQTMLFGPLKPVGLDDPKTGARPHAVVQLRAENHHGSCYNMVGFQTKLTYPEQRRVLRMIPGLEKAEFLRYGSLHRNTFINAPRLVKETLQLKARGTAFFAGQLVGVEGYTESAAMGGLAGINAMRGLAGLPLVTPPLTSAHGSLINYITTCDPTHFQPMNTNYGIFPPLPQRIRDKEEKRRLIGERAVKDFEEWKMRSGLS